MMGIFSNLIDKVGQSKIGQTIFKPGGYIDIITKPQQLIGSIVANPITTLKQGPGAALQKARTETFEKQAGKVVLNTAIVGAAVATGGTSVGRTAVLNLGKSLIPKTTGGKIIAGLAAPAVVTAVASNPKILTEAAKLPGKSAAFGADVGRATANPTKENILNIAKENPLITGLVVGAGALTLGKTLLPAAGAVTNIQTKESVQDLTEQLKTLPTTGGVAVADTSKTISTQQAPFSPTTAITPATATLPSTTTRARKATRKKQIPQSISQKVNVVVQNKNSSVGIKQSKNYLKRSILA